MTQWSSNFSSRYAKLILNVSESISSLFSRVSASDVFTLKIKAGVLNGNN